MTGSAWVVARRFIPLFWLCVALQLRAEESPAYHQSVSVVDGQPVLELTNDSEIPITAFVMMEFPSLGIEGRTYFDVYTNSREEVIAPGATTTRNLSSLKGSEGKVRAEVRAVVFKDGSTAGDPIWINAILARRVHLYDRLLSLHDLLSKQGGAGVARERIIAFLQAAKAEADKESKDYDLRVVDDTAFDGAISTFKANRQASVDRILSVYLQFLEKRAARLEYSRPDLDTIRQLPLATPQPLSEASIPAEFRPLVSALSARAKKSPGGLSSCTSPVGADFKYPNTEGTACYDSDNDDVGPTTNTYRSFSATFSYYDGSTGKTSPVPWSWQPGPSDLDTAYSVCFSYLDCDDAPEVLYAEGAATGQGAALFTQLPETVQQGQNPKSFYWTFDNYESPTYSLCDQCECPGCIENVVSKDNPQNGVTFYFNYACVVTP